MSRLLRVLWLEDNDDDVVLLKRAIKALAAPIKLWRVNDGLEACDFLQGSGKYMNREAYPLPDLIISDLKMPNMNGIQFVAWLRKQPKFAATPLLIFSTSGLMREIDEAVEKGAGRYWVKPNALDRWNSTVREIFEHASQLLAGVRRADQADRSEAIL